MLDWPDEFCEDKTGTVAWSHATTNRLLDFHGDPATAELVVFSDGNHHMALLDAVCAFRKQTGDDVFYTTTPPGPLVAALDSGGLRLGNLLLSCVPHVFISPDFVLEPLQRQQRLGESHRLFTSRGNVLLLPAGNPKGISRIADLARRDVKLFLSNPQTEKASYAGYRETLDTLAGEAGVDLRGVNAADDSRIVYGERIHHREAPEAVASGLADCAVVYHHLGLRYSRIFPDQLETLALTAGSGESLTASSYIALVDEGGRSGRRFMEYMLSEPVASLYRHHGMDHG